jgi:kynureninase
MGQTPRVADLTTYRDRFPILEHTTYLINHSLAAMPAAAEERLLDYARAWRERGIRSWGDGWWELPLTVGDQVGRLVGAPPGTVAMHQNVTVATAVVLSCFRFDGPRNRIVYAENEFPSVRYLCQAQAAHGAEIVVVPEAAALPDAIDERTQIVLLSHVVFKTGELQDPRPVVEAAHAAGAHVALDAYQSAGVVPLDVAALDVDFATGGSVKWLCGGPGSAWLSIRPDLAERLEPALTGWQAHARPFAFEPEQDYTAGAGRFLTGTPAVPALYAATAGYDVIEEVGVDAIRARSLELTDALIQLADGAGLPVTSPRAPDRRGGTVILAPREFEAVHAELDARDILCDYRPGVGIRLGPHFFNTEGELRLVVEQMVDIVETGAYERHLGTAARH